MTISRFGDRLLQTSTTTGTGTLTLAAAPLGFKALSTVYAVSEDLPYAIEGVDALGDLSGQWEVGRGHLDGSGNLVRDLVYSSSTGGFVSFSSTTLRVFVSSSAPALNEWLNEISTVAVSTALTARKQTVLVDASGGARVITLPLAASVPGVVIAVKKIDVSVNGVTVDGNGAETVDGGASQLLTAQWQSLSVQSNGTAWFIL